MNCKKCGELIADGERFCSNCGTPVEAATTANQTVNYNTYSNNNTANQGNSTNNNYGNVYAGGNNNYTGYNNNTYANNANAPYRNYGSGQSGLEGMFNDVGKKIELYAKVCFFISIGIAVIMLISSVAMSRYTSGASVFVALISGGIVVVTGYIAALMVYGFGKLIESVEEIKKMLKDKESK